MNPVEISCLCPGTPHERDTVTLKDPLPPRDALVIVKSIEWMKSNQPEATVPELLAMLTETYLFHCIESWTVVDENGKPIEPSRAAIETRLLANPEAALRVGDAADDLYSNAVILPLVRRGSSSSPVSSIADSTSAMSGTGRTPPMPSRPFLTSITQTAGTATITR